MNGTGMALPRRYTTRIASVNRRRFLSSGIFHALRNVWNTLHHLSLSACLLDFLFGRSGIGCGLDGQSLGQLAVAQDLNTVQSLLDQTLCLQSLGADNVAGIAHIKDLIQPALDGKGDQPIAGFLRDATFVPDTKDILPLLSEMQTSHDQIVVVVDEYGGTAGIITIEDIVEEIVGEIEDEFDPDNKYLTRLSRREWLVDGRFSCDDAIELGWPLEESDDYETIAGWILELCDSVPDIGEVFEVAGYKFKVQSMRGQRISLIRVIAPAETDKKDSESSVDEPTTSGAGSANPHDGDE